VTDQYEQKVRSIRVSVWILAGLIVVGTAGFLVLGHGRHTVFESLWMTLQILTTVGDTGLERTAADKGWSMVLMFFGVLAVFYLGVNLVAFVVDGELRQLIGRRQLQSQIKKMKDHFIVCGFGRMGRALCEALERKGAAFVLVDNSPDAIVEADSRGYKYLTGDAMSDEVLKMARIDTARGLATCLPEDADNVFVTLTARDLAPALTVVARANWDSGEERLRRAGANHVLNPSMLAANRAMTKFMLPAVDDLIEIVVHGPDLEVSKVTLDSPPGRACSWSPSSTPTGAGRSTPHPIPGWRAATS
jgi:voltage-gated potassium channel